VTGGRQTAGDAAAAVFREQFGLAVALMARVLGDIAAAEDAVQDAYAIALERWAVDGVPRIRPDGSRPRPATGRWIASAAGGRSTTAGPSWRVRPSGGCSKTLAGRTWR
jgi:hypothetical protein